MKQPHGLRQFGAQKPPGRGTGACVVGMAASVLLHGLVLAPLIGGGRVERHRTPDTEGSAASQHNSNAGDSMRVVFTDDSAAIRELSTDELASTRPFLLPQPRLSKVARPQVSAAKLDLTEEPDPRVASEANGNEPGRSMMFGRYMGQISARVERAWLRPRSEPAAGQFTCRAQITQDRTGRVEEIMLQDCTEDSQWQLSLVRAINGASPFPAPPDPSVFSNLITVEFDSDPYVPGGSEQGFEPKPRPDLARTDNEVPSSPALGRTIRELRPDGSVNLTIIGTASHTP